MLTDCSTTAASDEQIDNIGFQLLTRLGHALLCVPLEIAVGCSCGVCMTVTGNCCVSVRTSNLCSAILCLQSVCRQTSGQEESGGRHQHVTMVFKPQPYGISTQIRQAAPVLCLDALLHITIKLKPQACPSYHARALDLAMSAALTMHGFRVQAPPAAPCMVFLQVIMQTRASMYNKASQCKGAC